MELRWNPLLQEWIMVAGEREKRPLLPKGSCPFCTDAPEIPDKDWTVISLQNKYPSLFYEPPLPSIRSSDLYRCKLSKGACEIIVYTPKHDATLADLDVENIRAIIDLWAQRFEDLASREYVKYVFIFENKGREIGVALDHPHSQIYALPFIPPLIKKEIESSRKYWAQKHGCLFCAIIEKEKKDKVRLICENEDFICFLPFFAKLPYGVQIYPKRHVETITDLTNSEKNLFASLLKRVLRKFDNMFDMSFPYMMALHQRPTDNGKHKHYHFHVEFYPPYREKNKIKYFASVETGAGTVTFDFSPENKAKELRDSSET